MNARSNLTTPWTDNDGGEGAGGKLHDALHDAALAEEQLRLCFERAARAPVSAALDRGVERALVHEVRDRMREVGALIYDAWRRGGAEELRVLVEAMDAAAKAAESADEEEDATSAVDATRDDDAAGAPPPPGADAVSDVQDVRRARFQTIVTRTDTSPAKRPALTPSALVELQARMAPTLESRTEQRLRREARERDRLHQWYDELGSAPTTLGKHAATREIERFAARLDRAMDTWGNLPAHHNHLLTSFATKRLRAAQQVVAERLPGMQREHELVERAIRALSRHSKQTRPGFVHGLALHHGPEHGSWIEDAGVEEERIRLELGLVDAADTAHEAVNIDDVLRRLTEAVHDGLSDDDLVKRVRSALRDGVAPDHTRLVRLVAPYVELLGGDEFSALRRAVDAELAEQEVEADTDVSSLPAGWPGWAYTRGKRAVIVGGEPRAQRVEAIQQAFGFADVQWVPKTDKGARKVQALVERMKNGTIDLVICLRAFSSHKLYDAVFDVAEPQCERVLADTYGVTQIRLAIERDLGLDGPDTLDHE